MNRILFLKKSLRRLKFNAMPPKEVLKYILAIEFVIIELELVIDPSFSAPIILFTT